MGRGSPSAAAAVCVGGAVLGAFRKGCGAPGRRGPRLLSVWQAQYLEPPERVAARLLAVGRGSVCVAGAILRGSRKGYGAPGRRGPRLLSVWQAQYSEPLERVAARLVARLLSVWQAQYLEPIGGAKILHWCLPGMRVWQLAVCKLCSG